MKKSHLWMGFVFLTALVLAAGCGSDDDGGPTATPKPQDAVPAGFRAVALVSDGFVTGNAELLASLSVLGPKMGASIKRDIADPRRPTEKAIQQSCIPTDAQDKVFKYDVATEAYVPTTDAGAPAGGARFTLYELDASGDPQLPLDQHVVGFFDLHCEGQVPNIDSLTLWLVNTMQEPSGVTVLSVALKGSIDPTTPPTVFDLQASHGIMRDPRTDTTTDIAVLAKGTVGSELEERFEITSGLDVIDSRLEGFEASAGRWDTSLGGSGLPEPPLDSYDTRCAMKDASGAEVFDVSLDMAVDGSGRVVNTNAGDRAPLKFIDKVGNDSGILACFSDEYEFPLVEGAGTKGGCATDTIDTAIPQSAEDVVTYFDGYVGLLDLLDAMTPIYGVAMSVVTP